MALNEVVKALMEPRNSLNKAGTALFEPGTALMELRKALNEARGSSPPFSLLLVWH